MIRLAGSILASLRGSRGFFYSASTYPHASIGEAWGKEADGPRRRPGIIIKKQRLIHRTHGMDEFFPGGVESMASTLPKISVQKFVEPLPSRTRNRFAPKPQAAARILKYHTAGSVDRPGQNPGGLFSAPLLVLPIFPHVRQTNIYAGYRNLSGAQLPAGAGCME